MLPTAPDLARYGQSSRVLGEPPYSNWTAVGVNWLAGFDFEIKVIARIPG